MKLSNYFSNRTLKYCIRGLFYSIAFGGGITIGTMFISQTSAYQYYRIYRFQHDYIKSNKSAYELYHEAATVAAYATNTHLCLMAEGNWMRLVNTDGKEEDIAQYHKIQFANEEILEECKL